MTVNAAPAVSHEDGDQNSPFVAGLARRIPAPLGATIVGLVSTLLVLFWLYTLVVTWIGHSDLSTPLFQTTVVVGLVIGWVLIRLDLALTGNRGRRSRVAEQAAAVRPEPGRFSPLL